MKNKKKDPEVYFKDLSSEELRDNVNDQYPIDIRRLEYLVDRIHDKYPLIDKIQVSLIVRAVFESLRDFLILGYTINFNKFLPSMKLNFFTRVIGDRIDPALRVRLQTPPTLRK